MPGHVGIAVVIPSPAHPSPTTLQHNARVQPSAMALTTVTSLCPVSGGEAGRGFDCAKDRLLQVLSGPAISQWPRAGFTIIK